MLFVKAMVNPSQNTPDKAHSTSIACKQNGEIITNTPDKVHSTSIACKQNGEIITAHCTCKAG